MGKWYKGQYPTKEEREDYAKKLKASYDCPCGDKAKFRSTCTVYIISCPTCGREASSIGNFEGNAFEAIEKWYTDEPLTRDEQRFLSLRGKADKCKPVKPMPREMYMAFVDSIWQSDLEPKEKSRQWDQLYIDQAMSTMKFADRAVFSAYTPYGVKEIESWFIHRIQEIGTEKQWVRAKDIERLLLRNPHLHIIFKSDLHNNLQNYRKHENPRRIRKRQYDREDGPFNFVLKPGAWKIWREIFIKERELQED